MAEEGNKYSGRVTAFLKEHGWCQGARDGKKCCIVVASVEALGCGRIADELLSDLYQLLDPKYRLAVSRWNDTPGRTVEEVYELLGKVGA